MPVQTYRPKVQTSKVANYEVVQYQQGAYYGRENVYTIPISPSVASNSFSSARVVFFDLEQHEIPQADHIYFRFTISIGANSCKTIPFVYWITRLIIEANKGSGDELWRGYSDILLFYYHLYMDDNDRKRWSRLIGMKFTELDDGEERLVSPENRTWRANRTYEIYLPVPPIFFNLKQLDMYHISNEFRFRFEFNSDIIETGSAGTVNDISLDNIHLIASCFEETPHDRQKTLRNKQTTEQRVMYIDQEFISYNDRTIQNNLDNLFATDSFIGHCPALLVIVKPSTQPKASDKSIYDLQVFGEFSDLTFQNSAGQDLIGNGSKVRTQHLNNLQQGIHGKSLRGLYIIPFTENIKTALTGVLNGCHYFTGVKDFVCVKPKAGVAEVHTLGLNNAGNDAGRYRLQFEKSSTSVPLLFSANTTAIKTAIEGIAEVSERGYVVTVVGDATGASIVVTFTTQDGSPYRELGSLMLVIEDLNDGGVQELFSKAIVTHGQAGFIEGSDYTILIYMLKFKELIIKPNGNLYCRDI